MSRDTSAPGKLSAVKRALLTIQRLESRIEELEERAPEPIAVVGMACRFPGGADSPEGFWDLLSAGRDGIREIPADRTELQGRYDADPEAPGKMYMRRGGFLDQVEGFDAEFFRTSPREAAQLDPQQRLFLEVTWEALENAGIPALSLREGRTGVFAGMLSTDYSHLPGTLEERVDTHYYSGVNRSFLAGRLSHFLGLQGESLVVDTACSTSLVSVHLACRSLASGDSELALAGGVNLLLSPETSIYLCKVGAMSPTNECRAFDARADGLVRGEGCGVVVLKRLSDAVAAGDRVLAVIRGSAVNHDGPSAGLTVPNPDAQEKLYRQALASSGVQPNEVSYVEAHGTGTNLGDPVELQGLAAVYCQQREADDPLLIGSVKTNIGHTDSAAGVAGLMKAILSLQYGEVPPSLNFQEPNPQFDWDAYPLEVAAASRPLPASEEDRLLGVSSFGLSGINSHMLVQGHRAVEPAGVEDSGPYLLALSARSPEGRQDLAGAYRDLLAAEEGAPEPGDLVRAAATKRSALDHRLAVVADSRASLVGELEAFTTAPADSDSATGEPVAGDEPRIVFLCSGQGGQWWAMGRELLAENETFRRTLERIDEIFTAEAGWSLLQEMLADEASSRIHDTEVAQPAIFAMQVGLAEVWKEHGVRPDAVVGHSLGEAAAAHLAGALSLEDAVRVIHHRSRLLEGPTGEGKMMSVGLPPDEAEALVADYADRVSIAVYNSPHSVVLSGEEAAIEELDRLLTEREVFHRVLLVKFASHCAQVEPYQKPLEEVLAGIRPKAPDVLMMSTVTGRAVEGAELDASYWARNIRAPVRFAPVIQDLARRGYETFLEVDPHPILSGAVEQCLELEGVNNGVAVGSLHRELPERFALLQNLGRLWARGAVTDLGSLYPASSGNVRLPNYPWQRRRFWFVSQAADDAPHEQPAAAPASVGLLGTRVDSPLEQQQFTTRLSADAPAYLKGHRVDGRTLFPGSGYVEMALSAAQDSLGSDAVIEELELEAALTLTSQSAVVQTVVDPADDSGRRRIRIFSGGPTGDAWRLLARAFGSAGRDDATPRIEPVELVQKRCDRLDGEAFYAEVGRSGYEYADGFRCVEEIWVGEREALARIVADEPSAPGAMAGLHPALLDGALQAGLVKVGLEEGGPIWVPVRIGGFAVRRPSSGALWSHFRMRDSEAEGLIVADLVLFDDEGLVGEVLDLELQSVASWDLVGERDDDWCYEVDWRPKEIADLARGDATTAPWILFLDRGEVGRALTEYLDSGSRPHVVVRAGETYQALDDGSFAVRPDLPEDFERLLSEVATESRVGRVLFLWGLDARPMQDLSTDALAEDQDLLCGGLLHLVQAAAAMESPPSVTVVTQGAQALGEAGHPVEASQATLWGLTRVAGLEHPELSPICVDLDIGPGDQSGLLVREVESSDGEGQVAFRQGRRYVARLVRSHAAMASTGDRPEPVESKAPRRLRLPKDGVLDSLAFEPEERKGPVAGEVEVAVRTVGLNFRDVLGALGMLEDPSEPGLECAGVVSAVGDGVERLRVGDEVLAGLCPGSMADYAVVPEHKVVRKPAGLGFDAAATIPIAFLTAYYALHEKAGIKRGDRVLIHGAAGGVGQAAVQLCRRIGAEVFATASEMKQEFVRSLGVEVVMDSRTLDFADEIQALTDGEGVDVVLNSLADEFAEKSLESCARGARFVEIGVIGILSADEVRHRRPDVEYEIFDIRDDVEADPDGARRALETIVEWVDAGEVDALRVEAFPADQVAAAYRHMAQARHIGKIVIVIDESSSDRQAAADDQGFVLITGGLGALGLEVAEWLADQGFHSLALAGRSLPSPAAAERLKRLESRGLEVRTYQVDVAREAEVETMIDDLVGSPKGLRGVMHAPVVLDDGVLLRLSLDRFRRVFAAKVLGSWNLDRRLQDIELEFFVGFSSTVALLGSPGQGNYAAAGAFLDAMAHRRRAQGRAGLSINWGPWGQAGLAADLSDRDRARWAGRGIDPIPPEKGLDLLGRLLDSEAPQVAVLPVDWTRFAEDRSSPGQRLFLEEMTGDLDAAGSGRDLSSELQAASGEERADLVARFVKEQVARVLDLPEPERIQLRQRLFDLGLDSLMALKLKNQIEEGVGTPLRSTLVFDYPTVEALTNHLMSDVLVVDEEAASAEPTPGGNAEEADELADLSAEDLADLLSQELSDSGT